MTRTIMIIDDAESVRKAVGMILQHEGYDVIEAGDGAEALGKLTGRTVDMFICDVNMPRMDGVSCLEKVKTDSSYAAYRFAPFIMLTTEAGMKMKATGREAGARAWIVKPFKPEQLIDAVKKLLV